MSRAVALPTTLRDRVAALVGSKAVVRNVQWLFLEKSLRVVRAVLVGAGVARYLGPKEFG